MSVISDTIREKIDSAKNIVITGEEGVGKLKKTIEALQDRDNIYYIGNPFDYEGKWRSKGYDKYILDVMSLKRDLYIIANEIEILSLDPLHLSKKEAVVIIDEIYGRSAAQYEKLTALLAVDRIKAILITGCLKNIGRMSQHFDLAVILTGQGLLTIDREFLNKICTVLKPEPH